MTDILTKRYVMCPACNVKEFHIEHLFEKEYDNRTCTWSCGKCSARYDFVVQKGVFTMSPVPANSQRSLDLLRHSVDLKTLIVVIGYIHGDGTHEAVAEHKRYYYEEHTCPTNFLGVEKIAREGDQDFHGIFEFVRHVPMAEAEAIVGERHWLEGFNDKLDMVFPELAEGTYND